jgi:hypothetical protein
VKQAASNKPDSPGAIDLTLPPALHGPVIKPSDPEEHIHEAQYFWAASVYSAAWITRPVSILRFLRAKESTIQGCFAVRGSNLVKAFRAAMSPA